MCNSTVRLLFLGTGTSYGVPMIGCDCAVCRSGDPRNRRTRASVLVRTSQGAILIDTATELREQALRYGVKRVDAILYTHSHADHLHGIDDIRSFSGRARKPIPVYGDEDTISFIRKNYGYIFSDPLFRLGWGIPRLELEVIREPTRICGVRVVPVPLLHGRRLILGYRIGDLAYLTDCSAIPDGSWKLLEGLHTLVIDALRPRPHPTHFCISEALEVTERLRPGVAYFTHLTHNVDHATMEATLPDHVRLAYDGLEIEAPCVEPFSGEVIGAGERREGDGES